MQPRAAPRRRREVTMGASAQSQPAPLAAIPLEVAQQLCAAIRAEERGRWWSAAHWQCWGCARFTGGDPQKMCMGSAPGWRGCALVNRRYERQRG